MQNLRGFNLAGGRWEASWLTPWKCNVIRFGLRADKGNSDDLIDLRWFLGEIAEKAPHIRVIPVLWGNDNAKMPNGLDDRMFYDDYYFSLILGMWKGIAAALRDNPRIAAFDLYNEPSHRLYKGRRRNWNKAHKQLSDAIREIDPERKIIVESLHGDIRELEKLKLETKNTIASCHMYVPLIYTHQGILKYGPNRPIKFDRVIQRRVRNALLSIRRWQRDNKAKIFIGEFSCVRWADKADGYLKMCVDFFEAQKWPWCYHTLWPDFVGTEPTGTEQPWDLRVLPDARKQIILKALRANAS